MEHGHWFWVHVMYSYVLLTVGSTLLIRTVYGYPRNYRFQAGMVMIATLAPWVGNGVSILFLLPNGYIDVTPFAFVITGIALLLAGSRFRLFSLPPALVPTARNQALTKMADGMMVVDIEGRVVNCNPAAEQMLAGIGSSPVGRHVTEILGDAVPPFVRADEGDSQFEVALGEEGSRRYFDVVSSALGLVRGISLGRLLVFRDITERKRMESELADSELRLRAVLDNSSDLIVVLSVEGVMRFVSLSCRRILGYETQELVDQSIYGLVHPDDVASVKEAAALLGDGVDNPNRPIEVRGRHRDGSYRTLEVVGRRLETAEGEPLLIATGRDITERKVAEEALKEREEQLRQSQKMEAIGRLAGGIAHDFNNMLTAIIGNSSLLLDALAPEDRNREMVVDIKEVGERAAGLTSKILAFSRRQILKPESLRLNDILAGMEPLLRRTLGEDIQLDFALAPDLRRTEADRHQLEQAVMNLAVNSRDAMPRGGRLTFKTADVELDRADAFRHPGVEPGRYVTLVVSDTGCGVDEETKAHIFEPFFTTKEPGRGTGLGLSTVLGMVEQSGGTVSIDGELGQGTTFTIYLPTSEREAVAEKVTPPPGEPKTGTETILVVEDEALVRKLVVRVLSQSGYQVLEAGSIHEVEAVLEKPALGKARGGPDLLLTDVLLPGGSGGREVAEMLRARYLGLPVIFMSGYARDSMGRDGRLEEGIEFLGKPFTSEQLLGRVRTVLDAGGARA